MIIMYCIFTIYECFIGKVTNGYNLNCLYYHLSFVAINAIMSFFASPSLSH